MIKLLTQEINWDDIPWDVEEVAIYNGEQRDVWYKDITPNGYYIKSKKDYNWVFSSGKPLVEERIKRPTTSPNTFTKSMLVAGKHIVEVRHPYDGIDIYELILLEDNTLVLRGVGSEGGFNYLESYDENLTAPADSDFDIIKVFVREYPTKVQALKLIWERTPAKVPTQKELQLAALQDTINKAQEQIEELMKG